MRRFLSWPEEYFVFMDKFLLATSSIFSFNWTLAAFPRTEHIRHMRVFLRVLRFSSLCKFDFHAKIWAYLRNWR